MRFEVLGGVRAFDGERDVGLGNKTKLVLATLLARPNRSVSVDALMDCLWGDEFPASGANTLQWHVHQLRKRLGRGELITFDAGAYTIHAAIDELDSLEFEEALARSYPDGLAEFEALGRALDLWRGDAFGSQAEHRGVRDEARRLDQLRITACERRVEAGLGLGEHEALVPELTQLVRRHPGRERFRAQSMLALHRCGRRAEALRVYREARDYLVDELGLEPGTELRELERRILNDDPDLGPAPPSPRPPRTARARVPAELPVDVAAFTGRAAELAAMGEQLGGSDGPAVVAVDGVGGMGKSSLAVRAAHLAKGHYPDGQLYVNLHGATPDTKPLGPAEALARFLRSLGDNDSAKLTNVDEMASRYRSLTADLSLLIVLDDALDVGQVRPLLPAGGNCATIITSRRRLSTLSSTFDLTLDRLTPAESVRLLTELRATDRAKPSDVDQLVEWCDGMPLALTVCAARLLDGSGGSAAALVRRLADAHRRLSELRADDLAVRLAFQVSYDQLGADPRHRSAARLFRLLGLHDGSDIGLPAAAALADASEDDTRELLEVLTAIRLLEEHRPGRFRGHDLIRLYMRDLVGAEETGEEREAATRRMYIHYCAAARSCLRVACPSMTGPLRHGPSLAEHEPVVGSRDAALAWVDAEWENVRDLTRSLPPADGLADLVLSMATATVTMLQDYRSHRDGIAIGEALVSAMERAGDAGQRGAAYSNLGHSVKRIGRLDAAKEALLRSRSCYREAGDPRRVMGALGGLASVSRALGEWGPAEEYAVEAHDRALAAGAWQVVATMQSQLAYIHEARGETAAALAAMRRAAEVARTDAHAPFDEACAMGNLGHLQFRAGDRDAAMASFRAVLELDRRHGFVGTCLYADHLWGLARVHHDRGERETARRLWNESADILREHEAVTEAEHRAILDTTPPPVPAILR